MDMQNTGAAALTVYDRICLTAKTDGLRRLIT